MYDEMESYISDSDNGEVGWSILLDLTRVPSKALPWLAQFAGVRLNQSLSDAAQRDQIAEQAGLRRGSLSSIISAAQQFLTGTKDVIVIERLNGNAYQLYIATRTAQTPNALQVETAIRSQKPAGLVLTYETISGQSFSELLAKGTMQNVYTTYATFQAAYTGP